MTVAKTFHRKADGSTVVIDNGKIATNLPSPRVPTAAPSTGGPATAPGTDTVAGELDGIAMLYSRFETAKPADEPGQVLTVEELTSRIDSVDGALSGVSALQQPVDDLGVEVPFLRVGDLGCDPYSYNPDDLVTKADAEYLLRLEKATLREARTDLLKAADVAAGTDVVSDFGDRPLGAAINEGVAEPNSREWLLARTQGIGGSEKIGEMTDSGRFIPFDESGRRRYLHKILARKTPAAVAAIESAPVGENGKIGETPIAAEIGNRMERTVQYEFAKAHPEYLHFEDKATRSAPGRAWHRFNVDGILQDRDSGDLGVFEAKTSKSTETFEKARRGYMAQCLHNVAGCYDPTGQGPQVTFAVLVADVEGEAQQRVLRMDFTEQQILDYRAALDRVWLIHKPEYDGFAEAAFWA